MPIRWNVRAIRAQMKPHGLTNANQLHAFTGLTVPTAYNVLRDPPPTLDRVETATLETLAKAFDVEPWVLLSYRKR